MIHKRDKKDEEDGFCNPFARLDKTSVLQEARVFNETPVNPRKCSLILTKILYLINTGMAPLTTLEATDAFFNMTKLFQSKDSTLRRLVYIGIKELSRMAENVYVVTSSLTTDMNAKDDQCRPAALRALCQITEASTFQGIERYMKQAIVDRNPTVSSAALVSSLHLAKNIPDGVKRWANEAQEALNSDNIMVQYHALGLLYHIRKSDRLAVTKLVTKLVRSPMKSPFAVCQLIRISAKLIEDEGAGSDSIYYDYIESCLRHKSEMVIYEAANAIINLSCTSQRELQSAISVLQLMLSSSKSTNRFAAVRALNKIAMNHPNAVMACNVDLENLITDNNRSIATLAITTLLKTGNESSVERLMKQIASFMSEISDEFKIVVVGSTRALCAKFPRKHTVMMSFLSSMLHEEGGYEYKKSIVDTIIAIIEDNPEAKEAGLAYLCEFIEDCEHTSLAVKILYLLGREGVKTAQPAKYIRYIYNRLILEKSPVRAAAVSSLAKFAAHCEDLLPQILVLLERSVLDADDEVRDRATYYINILAQQSKSTKLNCISSPLQVSMIGLEKALSAYLQDTHSNQEQSFDIKQVPLSTAPITGLLDVNQSIKLDSGRKSLANGPVSGTNHGTGASSAIEKIAATRQDLYAEQLASVSELSSLRLGPILKSSLPLELTESETEYVVQCIKHMFREHIVLQFDCTNTLNDQILEQVSIDMEVFEGFRQLLQVKCDQLVYNTPRSIYVVLAIDSGSIDNYNDDSGVDISQLFGTFTGVTLKYLVKDCDPNTNQVLDDEGYQDEYALEDVDILISDYMQKLIVPDFQTCWEESGEDNQVEETYALSNFKTLDEAIKNLVNFMDMNVCDRSDRVPDGKNAHTVFLSGLFRGQVQVLICAKLAQSTDGITMKITVRSSSMTVSEYIASAIV
ncbi:coat protein (coatomer) gamma [Dermatophagoides farinae]|uniref:Coatomer subunit gamma n=1 Tax=Dermatophagoides farinae TaxID=6954 RepID=A0A922I7Q5_DERFA|nr:coatomer subunit gamma-2-like [Dermatophagoides farinae]KAH7640912.1 coatomer subunit gamma-like protein [Dermatophagoides farinae]KAH9526534.1 Coatomer subunit gamma-1 [Dermatophagoides farinae]